MLSLLFQTSAMLEIDQVIAGVCAEFDGKFQMSVLKETDI